TPAAPDGAANGPRVAGTGCGGGRAMPRMTQRLAVATAVGLELSEVGTRAPSRARAGVQVYHVGDLYAIAVRTGPFGVDEYLTRLYGDWALVPDRKSTRLNSSH